MSMGAVVQPLSFASSPVGHWLLLAGSFALLLAGAEVFTNGVEWLGRRLGVSESATGSILAAVGTALPETMIPVIAIVQGVLSGDMTAANEVGVGAILGAPFMLATIAMFLVGSSVFYFSSRRTYGTEMHFNDESTRRDIGFFLVGYTLAFVAALVRQRIVMLAIGAALVVLYVLYLYLSLRSGELVEGEELDDLHLGRVAEEVDDVLPGRVRDHAGDPHWVLVGLQTAIALGLIIGGAHLFVTEVEWVSEEVIRIPPAIVALLIAPLATELPEKFNSVLWISRDKDTLALGNITGAMAFQGTLPVTLGIVFTSWNLTLNWGTAGFLNALSAILAIVSGTILYLRARNAGSAPAAADGGTSSDGVMQPTPFLIGGVFYAAFIVVVVYHVLYLGVSATGGH